MMLGGFLREVLQRAGYQVSSAVGWHRLQRGRGAETPAPRRRPSLSG